MKLEKRFLRVSFNVVEFKIIHNEQQNNDLLNKILNLRIMDNYLPRSRGDSGGHQLKHINRMLCNRSAF